MANKEMLELEALVSKLDEAGEDEVAIQKVFESNISSTESKEELSEVDLENVAGGLSEISVLNWLIKNTKLGKLSWKGAKVCARCLYDYAKYGDPYRTYSSAYVSRIGCDLEKAMPGWMKKVSKWGF